MIEVLGKDSEMYPSQRDENFPISSFFTEHICFRMNEWKFSMNMQEF